MIRYVIENEEIVWLDYVYSENGIDIEGPVPQGSDYKAYAFIRELVSLKPGGAPHSQVRASLSDVYSLAETDGEDAALAFSDLGFPPMYDGPVYVSVNGPLADPNLKIRLHLPQAVSSLGIVGDRPYSRKGFKIDFTNSNKEYSCRPSLYRLAIAIDSFNTRASGSSEEALLFIARIKKTAIDAGAKLDSILESEEIIEAGRIRLEIKGNEGEIEIIPHIDVPGQPENAFAIKFDRRFSVDSRYDFDRTQGRGRTRLVVPPEKTKALSLIKSQYRRIGDPEKLRSLIENPPPEFDNADVDVSELYSDRVKGFGLYRPKSYPFISLYKSEWIAGIMLEDIDGKRRAIGIKNEQELEALLESISNAERAGKDYIDFRGEHIDLVTARDAASEAQQRIRGSQKEKESPEPINNKVLIIKENIEDLEYRLTFENRKELQEIQVEVPHLSPSIELKLYQKNGVSHLWALMNEKYPGAILADDMGLGKTLQVLSLLELASEEKKDILACIVCPVGLIGNWISEYRKFFPEGNLHLENLMNKKELLPELVERRKDFSNMVMVFSYDFLRRNQLEVCKISWDIALLDEAQKIKTPGTLVTNAAKALKAGFKIAITGTPVENTFHDLWCIADFCIPGYLGSAKNFSEKYGASKEDSEEEIFAKGERLREELGPCFIRRIKEDVLKDLPPKYQSDIPSHEEHFRSTPTSLMMPDPQTRAYNNLLYRYLRNQLHEQGGNRSAILSVLQKMKLVSEHPALIQEDLEIFNSGDSAKVISLFMILDRVKDRREKAIVFAEFKRTQRMIATMIHERYQLVPEIVNGDTPAGFSDQTCTENRLGIVRKFNESRGFNVIIMSPVAAGVGLNVTGANHVIHFSRHWNPAKEEQATDRAYRIGQEKPVYVYYLIAKHPDLRIKSFDENLAGLLAAKRNLKKAVLFPSEMIEASPEDLFKAAVEGAQYLTQEEA